MEDTWLSRDLPVLDTVVGLLDEGNFAVTVADVAGQTGFDTKTVDRALNALESQYVVKYQKMMTGGIPDSWYVTEVTASARRAAGQWPTAASLAARLAAAVSGASDAEQCPKCRNRRGQ